MSNYKVYIKAIAAFVAALGATAGTLLLDANVTTVLPQWAFGVLSSLVAAGVVAGIVIKVPANILKPEELAKQAPELAIAVAKQTTVEVVKQVESAVTQNLPNPARTQVQDAIDAFRARVGV